MNDGSVTADALAEGTITAHPANDVFTQGERSDGRAGFWIIGVIINLSVLTLFLIWAVREWRKKDR